MRFWTPNGGVRQRQTARRWWRLAATFEYRYYYNFIARVHVVYLGIDSGVYVYPCGYDYDYVYVGIEVRSRLGWSKSPCRILLLYEQWLWLAGGQYSVVVFLVHSYSKVLIFARGSLNYFHITHLLLDLEYITRYNAVGYWPSSLAFSREKHC